MRPLYLGEHGYLEPNPEYINIVCGYLHNSLLYGEVASIAKVQTPNVIIFPNRFADFLLELEAHKSFVTRFKGAFKSRSLISQDNIIGLFGEIRFIEWLWKHDFEFGIIPKSSESSPDFKLCNSIIEIYTPIMTEDIYKQTINISEINHPLFLNIKSVSYNFEAFIKKIATRINKKIKKQLTDNQNSILMCNVSLRTFFKYEVTPESDRSVLELLYDKINDKRFDKQEIVQIAWGCTQTPGSEGFVLQQLSEKNNLIMKLLSEFTEYKAYTSENVLYRHFDEIKQSVEKLQLIETLGDRKIIITDDYNDTSILITSEKIISIKLKSYLKAELKI